jgi:hypothetical protein
MTYITYNQLDVPNLKEIHTELTEFILPYCEGKPTGLWSVDLLKFFASCTNTVNYLTSIQLNDKLKINESKIKNQENCIHL